jgi:transcriptional regulator with XRE-family HTH domain
MPASKHDQEMVQWDPKRRLEYERIRLRVLVTARIENLLEGIGLKQSDLAKRISKSSAWVSKVLNGNQNVTLDTIAEIGWALGVRWDIQASPTNRESTPASADEPLPDWVHRQSRIVVRPVAASGYSLIPVNVTYDIADADYLQAYRPGGQQVMVSQGSTRESAHLLSTFRFAAGEQFDLQSSWNVWSHVNPPVSGWIFPGSASEQPDASMSQPGETKAASAKIEVSD